jgi:hypothetical protein
MLLSAKIIGSEILFIMLGKSFIYRREIIGPRTEPCGTRLTLAQLKTLLLLSLSLYVAVLHYLLSR